MYITTTFLSADNLFYCIIINGMNGREGSMNDLLKVGIITTTHGVHGEVKVYPTTDNIQRFKKLRQCILDMGREQLTVEVEGCKFFKNQVILKFKGFDNINDIEQFRQKEIFVTRENAVKLDKNEYFITDLIDTEVLYEDGNRMGILSEVMQTGANDVYIVKKDSGKEVLIPAIKQCILNVDLESRQVIVHLLEGMDA